MTDDDAFIAEIHASPYDDMPRLIYADWLEEQGDSRSEYLRLEVELNGLRTIDALFEELKPRFDELRSQCDRGWLANVGRTRVANCGSFAAGCPKRWEYLTPMAKSGERFCGVCRRQVHFCLTKEEIIDRSRHGACIAIDTGIPYFEFEVAHREGKRNPATEGDPVMGRFTFEENT